jgi:phosphatidylethanolamine-binding protein (PEBP) family uncharacterized protein
MLDQATLTIRRADLALTLVRDCVDARVPPAPSIEVFSHAFDAGGRLPARYTARGGGVSPSLQWRGVPRGSASVIVIVEDLGAGSDDERVHAAVWNLPGGDGGLSDGALSRPERPAHGMACPYTCTRWCALGVPAGDAPRQYAFLVLALDSTPLLAPVPRRADIVSACRGHVLGAGCLLGIAGTG